MTRTTFFCGIGLICASMLLAAAIMAQDTTPPTRPAAPERGAPPPVDEETIQRNWTAYMTPGPFHEHLKAKVGEWDLAVKMWQDPAAPPAESTGTSKIDLVMGDRFLLDHTSGSAFMGQPFEGLGLMGYDNMKKKYINVWCDNLGTGVMTSEGTSGRDGKVLSFTGQAPDMKTGRFKAVRTIETMIDADTWKMEMFERGRDRAEFKTFEVTYTRKK